ncbi:hypothetical protein OIU77_025237 [Salix suchowensis]|uniref:WPP DOMAIN-CONTAINING PROTEIN 1-RELATED n=2 Tax=Salix TaxID=40685 RepID=A0A9Q0TDQ9_9ROSI|nr:MFP1 attachment factor [Salix suchowensis]KAJ6335243.1 hypothetical protein OIU78_011971 [Salix suchowensis]KAJ6391209.1 hypothetical protein OIU77_025237 [Salix suchowensis]KAJ6709734.1 WPP DOMAIN-CONTAINING PROTEIN 1-RELATED [Salix koriyanagi]
MSDSETTTTVSTTAPHPEDDSSTMDTKKQAKNAISFSIWPLTQRTRDAVITRLIETLSTTSLLSKRYGTVPHEESFEVSRRIEEEAFSVATALASSEDDGLEVVQLYSKEISKRMLETVKARAGPNANGVKSATETVSADMTPTSAVSEEVLSSVETETAPPN